MMASGADLETYIDGLSRNPIIMKFDDDAKTDNIPNENQSGERHGEDNIDDEELIYAFLEEPTSLSVHGELGFRMFQICPINKFVSSYLFAEYQDASHPIKSISSCANHNIIAYVKESSPRVVRITAKVTDRYYEIYTNTTASDIISIRLNVQFLIVYSEKSIAIHAVENKFQLTYNLNHDHMNINGIYALSKNNILAYPVSDINGSIKLFDVVKKEPLMGQPLKCHENPIKLISFSQCGNVIATASIHGTLIRLFHLLTGKNIYELRLTHSQTNIYCIHFSTCERYLIATAADNYIYVFEIGDITDRIKSLSTTYQAPNNVNCVLNPSGVSNAPSTSNGWLQYFADTAASFVPTAVSTYFTQRAPFVAFYMQSSSVDKRTSCVMKESNGYHKIIVGADDGFVQIYNFDPAHLETKISFLRSIDLKRAFVCKIEFGDDEDFIIDPATEPKLSWNKLPEVQKTYANIVRNVESETVAAPTIISKEINVATDTVSINDDDKKLKSIPLVRDEKDSMRILHDALCDAVQEQRTYNSEFPAAFTKSNKKRVKSK